MTYHDTYVSCDDMDTLMMFLSSFVNYIQPQQGRAAVAAEGESPAIPAAGDPALFYSCIRATADISASVPSPITVIDAEIGAAVVGVWA